MIASLQNLPKLRQAEFGVADAVGRHLDQVFEEGDAPGDEGRRPPGLSLRCARWAYQAKVMKTLERASRPTVCQSTGRFIAARWPAAPPPAARRRPCPGRAGRGRGRSGQGARTKAQVEPGVGQGQTGSCSTRSSPWSNRSRIEGCGALGMRRAACRNGLRRQTGRLGPRGGAGRFPDRRRR